MSKQKILAQLEDIREWLSKGSNYKSRIGCKTKKELEEHQKIYKKELSEEMYERIEWKIDKF